MIGTLATAAPSLAARSVPDGTTRTDRTTRAAAASGLSHVTLHQILTSQELVASIFFKRYTHARLTRGCVSRATDRGHDCLACLICGQVDG